MFLEILPQLRRLYNEEDHAFSYFINKSQTHYYGAKITNGEEAADIHGSLLCLWAVLMILDNLEEKPENYRIIKPNEQKIIVLLKRHSFLIFSFRILIYTFIYGYIYFWI